MILYSEDEYRLIKERSNTLNTTMSDCVRMLVFDRRSMQLFSSKGSPFLTKPIGLRLSKGELKYLKNCAKKSCVSFNRFVHDVSLLSIKKVDRDGDIILISTDDVKDLRKQISFSSRNINQCARALNIIKKYPESSDYLDLIEKAALETEEVKHLLERISGNLSCLIDQKKHFTLTGRGR